ncbi:MAG: GDSL family lipase, partial [Selenomonadaceae bacterium]|nr:GDSL family lipase [Selenomonadaceae bacterium]
GAIPNSPEYHKFVEEIATENSYQTPKTAIPMYYLISAYGMFGKIFESPSAIANPNFPDPPSPVPIYKYTRDNPASLMPFLVWHTVPEAVCYEVELLSAPPEIEGGISLSKTFHLASTRQVFTNGWQADLRPYQNYFTVYWRARALGFHHEPIGEFCEAQPIVFDASLPLPNCPLINDFEMMPNFKEPLYPVYEWIPINAPVAKYEVELLDHKPPIENDVEPSPDSLWRQTSLDTSSCYDEYARPFAGDYYWRVRALDANGNPIGTWSNSQKFTVEAYNDGVDVAVFGDSISHGGGAVSYSPYSLEYSYLTYFDFPAVNLSRSGDTSHTSLERFDDDVLRFQPKNLIILTGTNSLRAPYINADAVIEDLREIGNKCHQNNIRPIFLTLMPINPPNIKSTFQTDTDPNWREKLNQINGFIRSQQYYIDLEPYFYDATNTKLDDRLSVDGLHPDIRGKMMMAEIINQHQYLFLKD